MGIKRRNVVKQIKRIENARTMNLKRDSFTYTQTLVDSPLSVCRFLFVTRDVFFIEEETDSILFI